MESVYNIAVKYLSSKYTNNDPISKYTPTDLKIKTLIKDYYISSIVINKELKTALDYVWLWAALGAFNTLKSCIPTMSYEKFLENFENRIVEKNNNYTKINYRGVIFKIVNDKGQTHLEENFECFDCLGNSFGVVNYLDIPNIPEGERYVIKE